MINLLSTQQGKHLIGILIFNLQQEETFYRFIMFSAISSLSISFELGDKSKRSLHFSIKLAMTRVVCNALQNYSALLLGIFTLN